jgi:hypothetical protein
MTEVRTTIPRFFLNKPSDASHPHAIAVNQVWLQPMLVEVAGDALGLAMFSSRQSAQDYLDANQLGSRWLITFFGYTELAALLGACQSLGATLVLREPRATFSYSADIGRVVTQLSGEEDTGDDKHADFELYTAASLRPPV